MDESNQQLLDQEELGSITCTTFNILAPIYKRLADKRCESELRELWVSRNDSILNRLLQLNSSIICLQELWVSNEELVGMYEKRLGHAGYVTYKLGRTNNRGDGLLLAVLRNHFHVLNYREVLFNGIGDRVAQLLHVDLLGDFSLNQSAEIKKEALIVNTHLVFPHDSSYCLVRLQQVYLILQYIEKYCDRHQLPRIPVILCGDWNGSKKGNVYKFLRSQGFVSSYDAVHCYSDEDEDSHKWISHRNHRGNICGVDYVWLLNPNKHRKPLKESFMEIVLGNIKNLLHQMSEEGVDLVQSSMTDGSHITYCNFSEALAQLGLCGCPHGILSDEDMKGLWEHLDGNRDGILDVSQINGRPSMHPCLEHEEESNEEKKEEGQQVCNSSDLMTTVIDFKVKKALLFPPEVEKGMWPENYFLSDHAHLTVEFSLVKMHYSSA